MEIFYFRYSYQRMNHKVLIRDILYFESSKRKVFIVTREETFEFYGKLNEIENSLKVCKISFYVFISLFLVNYKHIKGQSYDFVVMDNGKKISISEDRRKLSASSIVRWRIHIMWIDKALSLRSRYIAECLCSISVLLLF